MGTITSGVGLVSGLNLNSLVGQLMSIEARPRDLVMARIQRLDAQRTALADVTARISGILSRLGSLRNNSTFNSTKATSSNPGALGAVVGSGAAVGTYTFQVKALATTHQVISAGFASGDAVMPAGVITLESAKARVDSQTRLEELNGHTGVRRGSFRLTDGSGQSAVVNISDAITLSEVVQRINDAAVNVTASIVGDRIELSENAGKSLSIAEVGGGQTASDLGFGVGNTSAAEGQKLVGRDLSYLSGSSPLSALNDGLGVRRSKAGGDFKINGVAIDLSQNLRTDTRLGRLNHGAPLGLGVVRLSYNGPEGEALTREVDLAGAQTAGDIKTRIEEAAPGITVTLADNRFIVGYSDTSKGDRPLKIEDVSGSGAKSLGIAGSTDKSKINGKGVLLVNQVVDVVNAINLATGNDGAVLAAFGEKGLTISAAGGGEVTFEAGNTKALQDLGFTAGTFSGAVSGRRLVGAVNSALLKTLNGGKGIDAGLVQVTVGKQSASIDLAGAQSLADVVRMLNAASADASLGLKAGLDASGTRLLLSAADGASSVALADLTGNLAAATGLAGQSAATLRSDNLQRQYIGEATLLSALNSGRGVALGSFKITDSSGKTATVSLTEGSTRTVGDVIERINSAGTGIAARINDTGDGILLEDTAGGDLAPKVVDSSGTAARDLNLLGEAKEGRIDGSYELRVELSGSESLADLVAKINASSSLAKASIINDGSGINGFRLSLTARTQGSAGEMIVGSEGFDLGISTLAAAQDARVLVGTDGAGVLITSSSNTLTEAVPGLTLTLGSVAAEPVNVSVTEERGALIEALNGLVTQFNAAVDRIAELTKYNAQTQQKGILLGDGLIQTVESRLYRLFTRALPDSPSTIQRLSDVGFKLESGKLQFNEAKFNEVYEANKEAVVRFFTEPETGAADVLKKELEAITGAGGLLKNREKSLNDQKQVLSGRVDSLNLLLARKEERLRRQFNSMEQALAELQGQQNAVAQLAALVTSLKQQS